MREAYVKLVEHELTHTCVKCGYVPLGCVANVNVPSPAAPAPTRAARVAWLSAANWRSWSALKILNAVRRGGGAMHSAWLEPRSR